MKTQTRQKLAKPFMWSVIVLGTVTALHNIAHFRFGQLGFGYLLLAALTLGFGSR